MLTAPMRLVDQWSRLERGPARTAGERFALRSHRVSRRAAAGGRRARPGERRVAPGTCSSSRSTAPADRRPGRRPPALPPARPRRGSGASSSCSASREPRPSARPRCVSRAVATVTRGCRGTPRSRRCRPTGATSSARSSSTRATYCRAPRSSAHPSTRPGTRERTGFVFRCARRAGYGVSPSMARRCLERCDAEGITGRIRILPRARRDGQRRHPGRGLVRRRSGVVVPQRLVPAPFSPTSTAAAPRALDDLHRPSHPRPMRVAAKDERPLLQCELPCLHADKRDGSELVHAPPRRCALCAFERSRATRV